MKVARILLPIIMFLFLSNLFALMPISMRMRGLNPNLVGIVDDEYSDLFFNPAFINKIEGKRLYTNLSGIHYKGDEPLLDPNYSPELYYSLIGGITNYQNHKLGGIFEIAGQNENYTFNVTQTEIEDNELWIDSINYENFIKNTDLGLNLFWGKELGDIKVGLFLGPHGLINSEKEITKEISYYYENDTLREYEAEEESDFYEQKSQAVLMTFGALKEKNDKELSAAISFGYNYDFDYYPTKVLTEYLTSEISQSYGEIDEDWEKRTIKSEANNFYFSLIGRGKKRSANDSKSLLLGLSYINTPVSMTDFESTYTKSMINVQEIIEASRFTQKARGRNQYLLLSLGLGKELIFEASRMKNLFALGLFPSWFLARYDLTIDPEEEFFYHYHNYPSIQEYTRTYSSNETYRIKGTSWGLGLFIPVGMETEISSRLTLRLGVSQDLICKLKDKMETTMIDYGAREVFHQTLPHDSIVTVQESSDELDSYKVQTENQYEFTTHTTPYYGASYKISDNITLDFLNFAALTDLKSWRLGVNIKF
jgi:hypothetical protein